jgi:D-glycero-D-manno-heptose 1,7-bisphosphate phosphatase
MRAAFLDRDGVINRKAPEGEYIPTWREMRFLPGVFSATLHLARAGFEIIVVTNQRGVALGKVLPRDLQDLHARMKTRFAEHGVQIAGIYFCPHDVGENCCCRKPKPGMLIQAAREHALDLASSWMIGDSDSDVQAGLKAGCKTVRITASAQLEPYASRADLVASDLRTAAHAITGRSSQFGPP